MNGPSPTRTSKNQTSYRCIVADPPWQIAAGREIGGYALKADGTQPFVVRSQGARRLSYPTMTVEQLKALAPELLCEEQAHLYLWTVNAYLRDAFDVLGQSRRVLRCLRWPITGESVRAPIFWRTTG